MKSYIKTLREKIGSQKFIHPGARIILENKKEQFLFIVRKDNGNFGLPAGGFEEEENIEACIRREVLEETGLVIGQIELIGLSTAPNLETVTYPNGDQIQYFTTEFYSNDWTGTIQVETEETKEIKFRGTEIIKQLPLNEQHAFQSLDYFRTTGKVHLD